MNLCSYGHDEVCYEGHDCPACDALKELEEVRGEVSDLETKVSSLEVKLDAAEDEIADLKSDLTAARQH